MEFLFTENFSLFKGTQHSFHFSENQTQKILTLDITNLEESQKAKLRGAIRFFHGDRNNMNVQIKVNDEFKPCGQIYLTPEILQFFKSIVGEENCKI